MRRLSLLLIFTMQVLFCYSQETYDILLKASALRAQDASGEAVKLLTSGLLNSPDAELFYERGEAYLTLGLINESKADFKAAEDLEPGSGLYGLAKVAAISGDAKTAVKYLEALMKTRYKKTEPEINLEKSFTNISASPEWREFWKKEWYKGYEKSKWEIEYYVMNGKTDLAKEEYTTLSSVYPGTNVEEYCGSLIDIASGKPNDAVRRLSQVEMNGETAPEYILTMAKAQAQAGNYYAAALEYGKLIASKYNDPNIFYLRAGVLREAGDRDAALKDIEKYLSWYPEDSNALSLMGKTLAEEGSLYKALPYMNKNIELHPGEAKAYYERGDVYFTTGSWDNAISDYSMSLDLDPSDRTVYLKMGKAMINSGDKKDACYFLRKALEMGEKEAAKYISNNCNR
jgi:tetratricopeptide (TPR) repeat protein